MANEKMKNRKFGWRPLPRGAWKRWIVAVGVFSLTWAATGEGHAVEKWGREVIELPNPGYDGNPFEIEVDAIFTHAGSGVRLTLPGYYAGNDTWKIGFMPTKTGEWTYRTYSPDDDLDGVTGIVIADASKRWGMLRGDPNHPRKWKYTDGPYVVPFGLLFSVFLEETDEAGFESAADFLVYDVGGQLFNFRLTNRAFSDASAHQFDLALWDRLERRMEILSERNAGIMVMPYTDDAGKPGWDGQSETERLLIRYMVARLSGFPVVVFNTGIDIKEYRDQGDIDWYGDLLEQFDPYEHPRSSRHGGGSGDLVMANQTYDSRGQKDGSIDPLLEAYHDANVPVAIDDNWGEEFRRRGNFTPADIRRAAWKCLVAGGIATHFRDDTMSDFEDANDPDAWFHVETMADKLDSEQWIVHVNKIVKDELRSTFGEMSQSPEYVVGNGVYALADSVPNKILVYLMGTGDQWNEGGKDATSILNKILAYLMGTGSRRGEGEGSATIRLSNVAGNYDARWFDPRNGMWEDLGTLSGGEDHLVTPPSDQDFVLLLVRRGFTEPTPNVGSQPDMGSDDAGGTNSGSDVEGFVDLETLMRLEGGMPVQIDTRVGTTDG